MTNDPKYLAEARAIAEAAAMKREAAMEVWRMSIDKCKPWIGAAELADLLLDLALDEHLAAFGRVATAANLKALAHRVERGER